MRAVSHEGILLRDINWLRIENGRTAWLPDRLNGKSLFQACLFKEAGSIFFVGNGGCRYFRCFQFGIRFHIERGRHAGVQRIFCAGGSQDLLSLFAGKEGDEFLCFGFVLGRFQHCRAGIGNECARVSVADEVQAGMDVAYSFFFGKRIPVVVVDEGGRNFAVFDGLECTVFLA